VHYDMASTNGDIISQELQNCIVTWTANRWCQFGTTTPKPVPQESIDKGLPHRTSQWK